MTRRGSRTGAEVSADLPRRGERDNACSKLASPEGLRRLRDLAALHRCSRSLIQAGIVEVVYPKDIDVPERWEQDFAIASVAMMEGAGIKVESA